MLYVEYMRKADAAIGFDERNGISFLEPDYKFWLTKENLTPDVISDIDMTWSDVREVLELEVARRNAILDSKNALAEWIYNLLYGLVDVKIETDNVLLKDFISYLKDNEKIKEKNEELKAKEKEIDAKEVKVAIPKGISLSKK